MEIPGEKIRNGNEDCVIKLTSDNEIAKTLSIAYEAIMKVIEQGEKDFFTKVSTLEKENNELHKNIKSLENQVMIYNEDISRLRSTIEERDTDYASTIVQYQSNIDQLRAQKLAKEENLTRNISDASYPYSKLTKECPETYSSNTNDVLENIFENFRQFIDTRDSHMQCSICSELFIISTTLQCGHIFCEDCITSWKEKSKTCPVCRQKIQSQIILKDLDNYIDKFVRNFMPGEFVKERLKLISQRATTCVNVSRSDERDNESDSDYADIEENNNTTLTATPNVHQHIESPSTSDIVEGEPNILDINSDVFE